MVYSNFYFLSDETTPLWAQIDLFPKDIQGEIRFF